MADQDPTRWFADHVQPCEPLLRSHLRRRFPQLDEVEDVIQESYARVLRAWRRGRVEHPKAFLLTTATHAVFDLFRRRRVVQFESLTPSEASSVIDESRSIEETVCRRDECELMLQAINMLPPRCRQVMTLRVIYDLSNAEIADRLNIAVNTVKVQLAHGMRATTAHLKSHGVGSPAAASQKEEGS